MEQLMINTYRKYLSRIIFILVIFFIFLLHLSYIDNGYVWLDHRDIEAERAIIPLTELQNVLFTRFGDTGFYRPLVTVTESVDYSFYRGSPAGFHSTNIFLHLAVVTLVPLFISLFLSLSLFEIIIIMLLVGVHPLGWLPVGAIAYRPELLLCFFTMLTVYLHARSRRTKSSFFEFLTIISFFLALLSKETALFLVPMLILLWEVSVNHSRSNTRRSSSFSLSAAFHSARTILASGFSLFISEIIILALYFFLRFQAVPEIWRIPSYKLSLSEEIGTRFALMFKNIFHLVSPLKPNLSDAVLIRGLDFQIVLWGIIVIVIVIIFVKKGGLFSPRSKALFLLLITLAPALGIIPVPRLGSPHYGYVALIGLSAFIIVLLKKVPSGIYRKITYTVMTVWLGVMCYVTFISGFQFKNDLTLFSSEVNSDVRFLEGYFYLGNYYLSRNQYELADSAYTSASNVSPKIIAYTQNQSVMINLATTKAKEGKIEEADTLLMKVNAIASPEEKKNILYNRAILATQKKNYKKVIQLLEDKNELQIKPEALLLLANALHYMGRDKEAQSMLEESLPFWNENQRKSAEILLELLKQK